MKQLRILNQCLKLFGTGKDRRRYQEIGFKKIIKATIGRVNMATGTGKTILAAVVALYNLLLNRNKFQVIVVQAPVIILTYQLMMEFVKVFSKVKIDLVTLFTHSGSKANNEAWETLKSDWLRNTGRPLYDAGATLNEEMIKQRILEAKEHNIPVLILSTYKSAGRLGKILKSIGVLPEVVINDESHYLVSEQNSELNEVREKDEEDITDEDRLNASGFPGRKKYFFTATELHGSSDDGLGLNNRKKYGRILFRYTATQAIKDGWLTPVWGGCLTVQGMVKKVQNKRVMGRFVKFAYEQMSKLNKQKNKAKAKILIKANGSKQLKWVLESKETQELIDSGVNVLVIGSKVGQWINGEQIPHRSNWLLKAQEIGADPDKPMIIVHLQIIAEGFNVPGLNTFIPMSVMSAIKAIQNIGRILRPAPGKTTAIVAVPGFSLFSDASAKFKKLIERLISEYGWPGFDVFDDYLDPSVDQDDKDELPLPKKKKRDTNPLSEHIEDLKYEAWRKRVENKSNLQKLKQLEKLYGN